MKLTVDIPQTIVFPTVIDNQTGQEPSEHACLLTEIYNCDDNCQTCPFHGPNYIALMEKYND